MSDIEDTDAVSGDSRSHSREMAKEHAKQIQRLSETDPEFYQYLKEHDKELLDFNDEDIDEDEGTELEDDKESQPAINEAQKPLQKVITAAMVDSWCQATKEKKIGAVRSLLRAFRTACHYGDDSGNDSNTKFSVISSSVFNKIMVFVLNEMDGILRGLLEAPSSGGKKETIMELTTTKLWNKYGSLMKLYLGNALHILTQMTDEQMISFTLKRVKASAVFLAAFPALLRKYIKVALHSWGTGRGALPVVSFLFLRDLCVRLGSDCLDTCLKGVYKAYVMNCKVAKSVSISKLQHINFLGNCVTELYGVDLPSAYQHAFIFIRQLAEILRNALTERGVKTLVKDKTKGKQEGSKNTKQQVSKAHQKVYDWQFIGCLELWTQVICAYNSEADFRPLAYPLTQIISGVASLVPTARYFPLMLRCVRMLNRLAGATSTFIPVSALLLDMLDMKELNRLPTGGVGKAINLLTVKQVDKTTLKTRLFQEACVYSVIEELAEHLAQWSYAVSFFELSFVPLVQLRSFCKSTNVDKFRREVKELVRQIEANSEFTNSRRLTVDFSPNDPATESFLKADKESGSSPLSKFVADLRRRAQQRKGAMVESSVLVGAESSVFGSKLPEIEEEDEDNAEDGVAVFSSSWLPEKKSKSQKEKPKSKPSKKRHRDPDRIVDGDEDVVEDLVLSSDDDDDSGDDELPNIHSPDEDEHNSEDTPLKHEKKHKKQKLANSTKQEAKNKKSVTASSGKRTRRPRPRRAKKARKAA